MTDKVSDIPSPATWDYNTRGFEHIVDALRDGRLHDNLEHRVRLFETQGITPRQQQLVADRVGEQYAAAVISSLPRLAVDSLRRRALEEQLSLESAKIPLDPSNTEFRKYLELAGNPDQLGAFVAWMDDLSVRGLGQVIHRSYSIGAKDKNFLEHTKGLSFEVAGCFELGDHSHMDGVNQALTALRQQLPAHGMTFEDPSLEVDHRYDIARVGATAGGNIPRMYSVAINQPTGDIRLNADDQTIAHIAMRSDRLIVEPLLPEELRRMLKSARAKIIVEQRKDRPNQDEILSAAEFIKTMLGRYAQTDSAAVVPDATVVYMRTTREFDEDKVLSSLGLSRTSLVPAADLIE